MSNRDFDPKDFDYKDFSTPYLYVTNKRKLFHAVKDLETLKEQLAQLIMRLPATARNISIIIEYVEAHTRELQPITRQPTTEKPEIQRKQTDPTKTLMTWLEFSTTTADRIDQLTLTPPTTEDNLNTQLILMQEDLLAMFESYLWLMMTKAINFSSEHMNQLDPRYHDTPSWTPADDLLLQQLLTGCDKYLSDWTADIRTDAATQIREGVAQGETLEQIGERVSDVIHSSRNRGILIARTELMRAWNEAAHDRYQKAGFGEVWMTARDPDVCQACDPLDGKPIDEIGTRPPAHPNCRCGILPVLLSATSLPET